MSLIEKGEETLSRLLETDASVDIVYRRGEEAVSLPATVGKTEYETDNQFGLVASTFRDYIVDRCLLVISSGLTVPQPGDRIWETRRGIVTVYDVVSPGGDMQCYDHSGETRWRIHTKLLEEM